MLNQNVLLSAEMLNMLNVLGGARRRPQTKIIQHIQHFSRKTASFQKNIILSGEMLNMLNSGGAC